MTKKIIAIMLALVTLLVCVSASAEMTNRDYQLMGSVAAKNSSDVFFFCPMEDGNTSHWGLYSVNTCADGPIYETTNGYPAKLVSATDSKVYFLAYTNAARDVYSLYSVELSNGQSNELLQGISNVFIGDTEDSFFYVTAENPYTLLSYSISNNSTTTLKDMSKWSKTIYDAMLYNGEIYFTTHAAGGAEDSYQYYTVSNKAVNLTKPSPKLVTSLLYEGYQIYSNDYAGTRIYAVKIGDKKGNQIGKKYSVSLTSPRFGNSIYCYDAENNALVRCPLDGSAETSLALSGDTLSRLLVYGNAEEIYFYADGGIYSAPADLSSSTRLMNYSLSSGGQVWNYIVPAGDHIIMLGYGPSTFTLQDNMMPTGVQVLDCASGEVIFNFPVMEGEAVDLPTVGETEVIIGQDDIITPENEDTIFF